MFTQPAPTPAPRSNANNALILLGIAVMVIATLVVGAGLTTAAPETSRGMTPAERSTPTAPARVVTTTPASTGKVTMDQVVALSDATCGAYESGVPVSDLLQVLRSNGMDAYPGGSEALLVDLLGTC